MKLPRRQFLHLAAGVAALPMLQRIARAQTYPMRPVRIIVGFPAGGATDIVARLIGRWLSERLGQPFIIETRPGAATNIATEAVAHAIPDGYTLLAVTGSNALNATLYEDLRFNFIRDIVMVAGLNRFPLVLEIDPTVPVNTVPELIDYAKANPGKISIGSFGTATSAHVAIELLKMRAHINMLHVPYRGSAPMLIDLLGGQIQAAFDVLPSSIEYIKAAKLRPLAVTTALRSEVLPDIPTVGDFISGFEASAWGAVGAPKDTPAEVVEKLNEEINAGLAHPKIKARLADLGSTALPGSPADFSKLMAEETEKWGRVIRAANIRPE
jgi:tripartite-type tricarboxylate transporter receptor subunit TctC